MGTAATGGPDGPDSPDTPAGGSPPAGGSGRRGPVGAELFAEPGLHWNGVSGRLALARRLVLTVVALIVLAGLVACGAVVGAGTARGVFWAVAAFGLLVTGWGLWAVGRNAASRGWAEREQDLLVRRGFILRSLTVVPYGRMQVVEVEAGPLAGAFGFATVTLVTASAHTDARIPGVPVLDARALRDRLTARGETDAAGL